MLQDRPDDGNAFITEAGKFAQGEYSAARLEGDALSDEARKFAQGEYSGAMMKGGALSDADKADIAKKMARFTGLSEDYLVKANLRVNLFQFMTELQRSRGLTTGRLEARFSGPTFDLLGEFAEYDPQETAISGAF